MESLEGQNTTTYSTTPSTTTNTESYVIETETAALPSGSASIDNDSPYMEQGEVLGAGGRGKEYEVRSGSLIRPPRPLDYEYEGYKIEIHASPSELPLSHAIFSRHGNISLEQKKDGAYAYLIGDFSNRTSARNFLNAVMIGQYPQADVIKFANGQRVNN